MRGKNVIRAIGNYTQRLFQKRRIIVISDENTNHFAISGRAQFISIAVLLSTVASGSYITGSYVSARSVMEQQDEALKSVTSARTETLPYIGATLQPQNIAPVLSMQAPSTNDLLFGNYTNLDQDQLFKRIAFLETKVHQLKTVNETIIQTVQAKTNGKIADLENVIRKTGLDPASLKKSLKAASGDAEEKNTKPSTTKLRAGGPFIPAETVTDQDTIEEMFAPIDQLVVLNKIVNTLPLASPIQNAAPQSTFGRRLDPFTGRLAFHSGVDLAGPSGSRIVAANDGKVVDAGYNGAYGNMIDIDHGFGIVTRYGHLSQIKVQKGQQVSKGELIGIQGSTGRSTGAHLHYEVRYNDRPLNPNNFLRAGLYVSQN